MEENNKNEQEGKKIIQNYFYGGVGVEYFPLGNEKLRLHMAYFRDNHDDLQNLDIGITWRFNVYKR